MATIEIALPRPHSPGQKELIFAPENIVCFAGRRYGKTQAGVTRLLKYATQEPGMYWWVGLSWRSASMKRAWRLLKSFVREIWRALNQDSAKYIKEATKDLVLPNGSEIWLRTAEKPDSLAGEGLNGVIIDEFSLMREIVWTEFIEASLLDNRGWAFFIGVPKGMNWSSQLWLKAAGREGWLQRRYTSYDNPFLPHDKIDEIQRNTSERIFEQEYLAQIKDDSGAVFRNVANCTGAIAQAEGIDNHSYVFGVDWGKLHDYTVISVYDETERQQVALDRFNQIDYPFQLERLKLWYERFRPREILAEQNAMGVPLIDQLRRMQLPVRGFQTLQNSKAHIIEALALAFERESIMILADDILVSELQAYEVERLPGGSWRYGAPDGMHDDCVIATALSLEAATTRNQMTVSQSRYI